MCAIVGLFIKEEIDLPIDFLLQRIEDSQHRGYQGCGIASFDEDRIDGIVQTKIKVVKTNGKIPELREKSKGFCHSNVIIGHNRWPTHGGATVVNAHPHISMNGMVGIVHNGEVYNKDELKSDLLSNGYKFFTETDTEVIANLIELRLVHGDSMVVAIREVATMLDGANSFVVICTMDQNALYAYNNCQGLEIVERDEYILILSDQAAIPQGSSKITSTQDGDIITVTRDSISIENDGVDVYREEEDVTVVADESGKQDFDYYMRKEIMLQPNTTARTLSGRLDIAEYQVVLGMEKDLQHNPKWYERIVLMGIGTSYFSCLTARDYFERIAGIPCDVVMASEFFGDEFLPARFNKALVIVVSQSGKTVELVDVVKFLQEKGVEVASVSNVVRAPIPKLTHSGLFLKAGPEKAVASTKAFTSQLLALYLIALMFAENRKSNKVDIAHHIIALTNVPELIAQTLDMTCDACEMFARSLNDIRGLYYLGKGINEPLAHEGALKLQEVAYLNARGYSASEMFHGPRAMLDSKVPCVAMVNEEDPFYMQMISSIEKCHSTQDPAPVTIIVSESLTDTVHFDFDVGRIVVPNVPQYELLPFVNVIPMQLIALYASIHLGYDPDYPRNLAKVITTR